MNKFNLELRGINKSYEMSKKDKVHVLKNINMSVEKGELIAIVGSSGTGKSTLLHIAGLLDDLDSGEVIICGKSMSRISEKNRTNTRRDKIGFVYQFHHLIAEFTALGNVSLPQLCAGKSTLESQGFAEELLFEVGLSERIFHKPAELSGGERQRVALCRALANKPAVLLADEPTGNLDAEASLNVFKLIKSMANNLGISTIIATHDLELANRMDKILYLRGGELSAADTL